MADFSCRIVIKNSTKTEFKNVQSGQTYGEYESRPKTNLLPGEVTQFRLKDKSGPAGATGWAKYEVGEGVVQFNYDCPYGSSSNVLTFDNGGTGKVVTLYGTNSGSYESSVPKDKEGQYPSSGHPLSGVFELKD